MSFLICSSFKCYRVQRYTYSTTSEDCPALCRLKDVNNNGCPVDDLVDDTFLESENVLVVESPRYSCSEYLMNEVCVYNISMPCSNNRVVISDTASEMNIAGDGDFVQVIDYENNRIYDAMSGNALLRTEITNSNFLLLFWSEKDSLQANGFKLQFECPLIQETGAEELSIEANE